MTRFPRSRLVLATTGVVALAMLAVLATPAQTAQPRMIHVNDDAAPGGMGSASSPYDNLTDALADARSTSLSVRIIVAPGDYAIESSLVVDRSLELRGSSVLFEDAEGWPTGAVAAGTETRIYGTAPLGTQPSPTHGSIIPSAIRSWGRVRTTP